MAFILSSDSHRFYTTTRDNNLLLALSGCGNSNNQDNKDNMGNMDHSKMKMEDTKK